MSSNNISNNCLSGRSGGRTRESQPDTNEVTRSFQALSLNNNSTAGGSTTDSCGDIPVTSSQSTLSPYAQVFVPRQRCQIVHVETLASGEFSSPYQQPAHSYQAPAPRPSAVSNRLKISRPNIRTAEEYENFMRSNRHKPMEKLNEVIDLLQSNKISFEIIKKPFLHLAAEVKKDLDFLELSVKLILNETLHKSNFCYSGARLCVLFNKKVPMFHIMIAEQCLVYLTTSKTRCVSSTKDRDTVRGIVNSLGEIYYQFVEKGLKYQDVSVCSRVLYEAMLALINLVDEKALNIRTVCQSLKLSGRHLQKGNEDAMTNLLQELETAVHNEDDENMKLRVRNIRGLYNSNWGYEEETTAEANNHVNSCLDDAWEDPSYNPECSEIDDTVYYGPDGKVLTAEEISFLYCNSNTASNTHENVNASDVEDEDTLWDPENELGPELQRAFKEFVQYSKKKSN